MSIEAATRRPGSSLVLHQARFDAIAFWRNPQSRFFTLLMPIIFLVIFSSVIGGTARAPSGAQVAIAAIYVPGIATLAIVAACFVNLAVSVVTQRETGVLKRRRGTPVPAWALIAGRTLVAILVTVAIVAVVIILGAVAYNVHLAAGKLPAVVLACVVGAFTFCALAFAASIFIKTVDAAQPILQFLTLPLYFISGVFIPDSNNPAWLRAVADVFPVRHLAQALQAAFDPGTGAPAIRWGHLLVLLAWGLAGLAVAARRFAWLPR